MGALIVGEAAFSHPGGGPLFGGVSFKVPDRGHVALIGANGVGKSTLMHCIAGDLKLTAGSARLDGRAVLMPQSIGVGDDAATTVRALLGRFSDAPVRTAAAALAAAEKANGLDHEDARAGMRLAEAVIGWNDVGGYDEESRWDALCVAVLRQGLRTAGDRAVGTLSGGERKRLVLETVLASDAGLVLLDEPDNFLDIPAKRWLEGRIAASNKTILFISHDRELLAEAATAIVTLEGSGCWVHGGSWATYDDARRARNELLGDALQRWNDEERRLFRFYKTMKERAKLNDGNAPAANAAESRWKRFVAVGPPPPPPPERSVRMKLSGAGSGKVALVCTGLELLGLTEPFDLEVHQGDRVAVLGPNGTGKSHLLRLLGHDDGDGVEHTGTFRFGARVVPGLFHQTDEVPGFSGRTPLEILCDGRLETEQGRPGLDLDEHRALGALARYGLADGARRPVETLSGGQRARLQVLVLELRGVNLLLLDEPTDNLDLGSAESLEAALAPFEGTVISVTHDRWFLRAFDRFLLFDSDCRVREALDRDTALHEITGDARYPTSKARLLLLSR